MNEHQTEMDKKRQAWWNEHYKPRMSFQEVLALNEEIIGLFPMTEEERKQRWEEMKDMPEFVL